VRQREVVAFEHDIDWLDDPLGQTISKAVFRFEFDHGPPRVVTLLGRLPRFYLKAGMYGGLRGWAQGDDKGEYFAQTDVWRLDDAASRAIARTLSDHVMSAESEGERGVGISEYGVAAGYPKYLGPQRFPAM
jgi:hypothetical protein